MVHTAVHDPGGGDALPAAVLRGLRRRRADAGQRGGGIAGVLWNRRYRSIDVTPTETAGPAPSSPLDDFSHCHEGILRHLQAFDQLPGLLEPARQARRIAADMLAFFRDTVYEHHAQEEAELFPAVLASARKGEERDTVQAMVDRLTREHRQVESRWAKLEPALKAVAKGHESDLDAAAVASLVAAYTAHARFEESSFLPLSQQILGRDGNHMAALGLSLHLRHAAPAVMAKFGNRI
jgi:hemerythrin-like domain-containing protein